MFSAAVAAASTGEDFDDTPAVAHQDYCRSGQDSAWVLLEKPMPKEFRRFSLNADGWKNL